MSCLDMEGTLECVSDQSLEPMMGLCPFETVACLANLGCLEALRGQMQADPAFVLADTPQPTQGLVVDLSLCQWRSMMAAQCPSEYDACGAAATEATRVEGGFSPCREQLESYLGTMLGLSAFDVTADTEPALLQLLECVGADTGRGGCSECPAGTACGAYAVYCASCCTGACVCARVCVRVCACLR